ncbi:hypothetical protein OG948_37675 (plasmid) [Embleya sp. NBC_00888]|nr:hypothetical protein OG948_37675 [Embleya sp. NBC_00888]
MLRRTRPAAEQADVRIDTNLAASRMSGDPLLRARVAPDPSPATAAA